MTQRSNRDCEFVGCECLEFETPEEFKYEDGPLQSDSESGVVDPDCEDRSNGTLRAIVNMKLPSPMVRPGRIISRWAGKMLWSMARIIVLSLPATASCSHGCARGVSGGGASSMPTYPSRPSSKLHHG